MRRFLKLKALGMLALMVIAVLSVLPSLVPDPERDLPAWITDTFQRRFKLGLDLQGGLHLEYSVAVDEAIETKLDQVSAELENAFKEHKKIEAKVERIGNDTLRVHLPSPDDVKLATDDVMGVTFGLLERIEPDEDGAPTEAQGVITLRMPKEAMNENRAAAVANALETVRKRVDAMGVAEPNIYPKNRQIVVELPGLSDTVSEAKAAAAESSQRLQEELRELGHPQVLVDEVREDPWAFKITIPDANIAQVLEQRFAGKLTEDRLIIDEQLPAELQIITDSADAREDPATAVVTLSETAREKVLEDSSDFRRLLKIIERQAVLKMHLVDDEALFRETGKPYLRALYEAGMVRQGMGISVNKEADYGREGGVTVKEPFVFFAKDVETLDRFFNNLPAEWRLPPELDVAYGPVTLNVRKNASGKAIAETVYQTFIIKSRASVSGRHIVSASVGFNPEDGGAEVNVKLDREGSKLFEQMSGENVGRKMAIVLDDLVRSDPLFNEPIPGGNVRITLGATLDQTQTEAANELVKVLKSGSLPARLQKEFEIRVGADLGRDSVEQGFKAFVLGLGAVIVFMMIYYRKSGLIAVAALVMNMILMLSAMAFFQATLTLPGIAGVVLTIGMAVDANVLIFERIRDYLREGYTARAAIESGYDRAFTTILDAQLTTAIAGLVLYQYGSGPIQGFAITLMLGIVTSIFTGVYCSRLFFDFQANRRGFDKVSI